MSNYLSPMELPINSYLFDAKRKELSQLIGNLTIDEVKEDEKFQATVKRIKNAILLEPVLFEEPKIVGNYQSEKTVPPNSIEMWGGTRVVNVISVEFKFKGSTELFKYSPNGLSFGSSSNMRVYQPDFGNFITVEVELPNLDKKAALGSAIAKMEMTYEVIRGNNMQAEQQLNASIENVIESMANDRRKELLDFYS